MRPRPEAAGRAVEDPPRAQYSAPEGVLDIAAVMR